MLFVFNFPSNNKHVPIIDWIIGGFIVLLFADKPSIICPKGYFLYAQNCYGFKKELKTWDEARAACKKDHAVGELASVHDVYDAGVFAFDVETIGISLH